MSYGWTLESLEGGREPTEDDFERFPWLEDFLADHPEAIIVDAAEKAPR